MSISSYPSMAFRICGLTVLLACAVWQILFSLQEQRDFSEKHGKVEAAETRNVRALTYQAKQKHMLEADLDSAKSMLQRALTVNPSWIPAWLSLAELNNDLGRKEQAYAILQCVDRLTEGLKRWRWDKAMTAYQLGKLEMLPAELRYIIRELPGKDRNSALQLAFTLWDGAEELVNMVGDENIAHLLDYAVRKNLPQQALFFWHHIETTGVQWQHKEVLALLDMLLRVGEVQNAAGIWRKYFNPDKIFFNGDFTQPLLEHAFGWRTGKKQNFEQRIAKNPEDESTGILQYRFKGWDNINFTHIYQIVPLEGGKTYTLTAEMRSQKITTNQRPFLEVSGYKCKAPAVNSEMVAPDQDWTQHRVVVNVPEECAAVVVRLRRNESTHIDNKLAGQLWLRTFVIAETAEDSLSQNTSHR